MQKKNAILCRLKELELEEHLTRQKESLENYQKYIDNLKIEMENIKVQPDDKKLVYKKLREEILKLGEKIIGIHSHEDNPLRRLLDSNSLMLSFLEGFKGEKNEIETGKFKTLYPPVKKHVERLYELKHAIFQVKRKNHLLLYQLCFIKKEQGESNEINDDIETLSMIQNICEVTVGGIIIWEKIERFLRCYELDFPNLIRSREECLQQKRESGKVERQVVLDEVGYQRKIFEEAACFIDKDEIKVLWDQVLELIDKIFYKGRVEITGTEEPKENVGQGERFPCDRQQECIEIQCLLWKTELCEKGTISMESSKQTANLNPFNSKKDSWDFTYSSTGNIKWQCNKWEGYDCSNKLCPLYGTQECVEGYPALGKCTNQVLKVWNRLGKDTENFFGKQWRCQYSPNKECSWGECALWQTEYCMNGVPKAGRCNIEKRLCQSEKCKLNGTKACVDCVITREKESAQSAGFRCETVPIAECMKVNCALWETDQCVEGFVKSGTCSEYDSFLCRAKKCELANTICCQDGEILFPYRLSDNEMNYI